jgi:RNA polymerase sigma factor (sigma-70 family)
MPLRPQLHASLHLRGVLRLRGTFQDRRLIGMDARALLGVLTPERARFVRLARSRVETVADAEDVVQRALQRAATHAGALEDGARARAWFYRILRRAIVDHHRLRRGEPPRVEVDEELPDERSLEPTSAPCACTVRLLGELRPAYADVLRRIDLEGSEPSDVAETLGISVGNLHVRLHRARRLLRDQVKEHCGVATHVPCLDCTCDSRRCCSGAPRPD